MIYHNPILSGFYPDPSIVRLDDTYYIVNSSFEYLPGIPLFQSKDLINWEQVGNVIERPSQVDMKETFCSGGLYAPTIRCFEGYFYMITTCLTKQRIQNFFVKTRDVRKGWSDPVLLSFGGIDPSLFFENGKVYAQFASADEHQKKCIKQVELDLLTGASLGEERILTYGSGGRDVEGPHLYHHQGFYYLLCAEGGTREGHMITIHRSKHLWGPYHSYSANPIATNRDRSDLSFQGIGHGDLVEDKEGNWWMVCLGYRSIKHTHVTGRETLLVPVIWTADGWPSVKGGVVESTYDITSHAIQEPQQTIKDTFHEKELAPYWLRMRDLEGVTYRLQDQLLLYGNANTLCDIATPAFLGVRQRNPICTWETKLSFEGIHTGEAGICLYMDTAHHIEAGVRKQEDEYIVFVRKTVGEIQVLTKERKLKQRSTVLNITADKLTYHVYADGELLDWTYCKHLSTEVSDSLFNGVLCGLYVYGEKDYGVYHSFTQQ